MVAGVVLILAAGTLMVTETMVPNVPFQQESITRMDQARKWALAFILFADAHGNQLPNDFARLKTINPKDGLSDSNWVIVSSGDLNGFPHPLPGEKTAG